MKGILKSVTMRDALPFKIAPSAEKSFQLFIDRKIAFRFSDLPTGVLLDQLDLQPIVAYEDSRKEAMAVVAGFTSYCALEVLEDRGGLPKTVRVLVVGSQDAKQIIQSDLLRRLSEMPHPANADVVRAEAKLLTPEHAKVFDGKARVSADALAKRYKTRRQLFSKPHLKSKSRQPILSRLLDKISDDS